MTETPTPPYSAQLVLSIPGKSDSATITVTILPDDTISVDGQKKALADCTLRELRAFANTLEAEVWETYDEITLLDMSSAKEVAIRMTLLDKNGKAAKEFEDWVYATALLPASEQTDPAKQLDPPAEKTTAQSKALTTATKPAARVTKPARTEPAIEKQSPPEAEVEPETAKVTESPSEASAVPPAKPSAPSDEKDLDALVAAIAFPAPTKPQDIDDARPKPSDRPKTPATIKPSEARVRVAGKRLASGDSTWAAVDILMDEPPLRAMQAHALSSLDREVAGVMVGPRPEKQPDGRYLVRVIDSVAAKYTVMQGASVTYTADSWRYLNDTIEERYPNETGIMVGWYHTHPGFGIFLSGMDLFIHQNFFTQIWHTAYVLDPRARTSGFFCWSRDKSRVSKYDFGWPDWTDGSW